MAGGEMNEGGVGEGHASFSFSKSLKVARVDAQVFGDIARGADDSGGLGFPGERFVAGECLSQKPFTVAFFFVMDFQSPELLNLESDVARHFAAGAILDVL
jgi:hypothetical protein